MLNSIVLPSYNHEAYIEAALDSCYKQNCDTLQLVICDDFSKDKTRETILRIISDERFKKRFHSIKTKFHAENIGSILNIESGINAADGDIVHILNTDDYFQEDRLEAINAKMRPGLSAWGFTGVQPVDESGRPIGKQHLPESISDVFDYYDLNIGHFGIIELLLFNRNIAVSTGNLFFTRDFAPLIRFFTSFKYCADWGLALCMAFVSSPVYIQEKLLSYRVHGTNSFRSLREVGELECDVLALLVEQLYLTAKPFNREFQRIGGSAGVKAFLQSSLASLNLGGRQGARADSGVNLLTNYSAVSFCAKLKNYLIENFEHERSDLMHYR